MQKHSWKTIIGLAIIFIIGGLQALHGQIGQGTVDMVVSFLLVIEHALNGNIS